MTNANEVLDEAAIKTPPEKNLWAAVILQAMGNVHFGVKGWHEDAAFISGAENWGWICEHLGLDARLASKLALRAAFTGDNFKKH